jgi:hypothetical protein
MDELRNTQFPRMARVKQRFPRPVLNDIPAAISSELAALRLEERIKPGDTVALTAGSRGIANIATIVRAAVDHVKRLGAVPFVFPAMGSHGGATPEGQAEVLHHYGITEETMGCPIRCTMDVVEVGQLENGTPVYLDGYAREADHVGIINRVKPHTDFHGSIESGLCKMMAIGIGKQHGASHYHKAFLRYDFEKIVLGAAEMQLARSGVAFGLAILENAYDETASVTAVAPDELIQTEQKLIREARDLMGRLPTDELDCLIVDQMGKNISGTGMDTNLIGRAMFPDLYPLPDGCPSIMRIFVRGLTPESDGNASGIGFADVATQWLIDGIDRHSTMMNAFTANTPHGMKTPVAFDTDREALAWVLNTLGLTPPEESRTVRIHTTLHIDEVLVSEALLPEVAENPSLEIVGDAAEMAFGGDGNLLDF